MHDWTCCTIILFPATVQSLTTNNNTYDIILKGVEPKNNQNCITLTHKC